MMKTMTVAGLLFICSVGGAAQQSYPYDVVASVLLPKGDIEAGRKAFQDLKCHLCHRVAGEKIFAAPVAPLPGPHLTALLQLQDTSAIAAAIIAPSHSMSIRTSESLKARLHEQGASPMGDFSRAMTVRQLADLLAYLRSVR